MGWRWGAQLAAAGSTGLGCCVRMGVHSWLLLGALGLVPVAWFLAEDPQNPCPHSQRSNAFEKPNEAEKSFTVTPEPHTRSLTWGAQMGPGPHPAALLLRRLLSPVSPAPLGAC